MFRILIVDDDADKLRSIHEVLSGIEGVAFASVDDVRDVWSAKRELSGRYYDLMVLDIAIPARSDQEVDPLGGVKLLMELNERDKYRKPGGIIGLTAHDDVYMDAEDGLGKSGWTVLRYDTANSDWQVSLKQHVEHLISAKEAASRQVQEEHGVDVCVLAALKNPELSALQDISEWSWKAKEMPDDPAGYYEGVFTDRSGDQRSIICTSASRMGLVATAISAMKMINHFRPKYIVMVGILAGVEGKVNIGDVIVADPAWDWGSGKRERHGENAFFVPSPHQVPLVPQLRALIEKVADNHKALGAIKGSWRGTSASSPIKVIAAPVASGAAVLADPLLVDNLKTQHRKVTGIDMETYALYDAANEASDLQPKVISIKAVSDFADEAKNDNYQPYAAYVSARVFKLLAEEYLPFED